MSQYFDHEKLDVYRTSIEFVVLVDQLVDDLPRGRAYLADQVQRAASSIALNIAEGAGEYSSNEKIRFYRMAKRSATECASILDICNQLQIVDGLLFEKGRSLLLRIVAMLIKLSK